MAMSWASEAEARERFLATTVPFAPADPGDIRFEHFDTSNEDAPFGTHMIDERGEVVETHFFATSWERSSLVGSFREAQERREEAERLGVHPLELALAPFGPEWQAEQIERGGVFA
jgi:hypothetical protein